MSIAQKVNEDEVGCEPEMGANESSRLIEIRDQLIENPSNWEAFDALGKLVESEGDAESARGCYLGRMPLPIQERLFSSFLGSKEIAEIKKVIVPGHVSTTKECFSRSIESSPRIQKYMAEPLVSNPTETAVFENVNCWYDRNNTAVSNKDGIFDSYTLDGNVGLVKEVSLRNPTNHLQGNVVLMGGRGSNNFYHWMADFLPKFAVLEKSGINLSENTSYIFASVTSRFQIDTLKAFGIDSDQIYQTDVSGSNIHADTLFVPRLNNSMGLNMGAWLPEYLKEAFGIDQSVKPYRKILVSRDPAVAHGRGVINLQEYNDFFLNHGYEILFPEKYTVFEQAKLFSEATHIAGPHGAGLTNLCFCQPGTRVYEFYGEHFAPCFWAISELLGLDYINLYCSDAELRNQMSLNDAKTLRARRTRSFAIDLDKIDLEHI